MKLRRLHMRRTVLVPALILWLSASCALLAQQSISLRSSASDSTVSQLSLIAEYPNKEVLDLSADGRRMLVDVRGHVAVLDLQEDRKIARWKLRDWVTDAWFMDDGNRVFYSDFGGYPRIVAVDKPTATTVCPFEGFFGPLDKYFALGSFLDDENTLIKISLEDCSKVDERSLEVKEDVQLAGWTVSPDRRRLAYGTSRWVDGGNKQLPRETEILVVDFTTLEVVAKIENQDRWPFTTFRFTPDNREIVAGATEWLAQEDVSRFFVFDASDGSLVRHWDFPGLVSGWSISPDGSLLAIGAKESEEREGREWVRMSVRLFEFHSSRELARDYFPWKKVPKRGIRWISWGGGTVGVRFSPDGKKLYASSEDTKVWEIPEATRAHAPNSSVVRQPVKRQRP